MNTFTQTYLAIRIVFGSPRRMAWFFMLTVFIFGSLVWLPVKTIPGNDVAFQLSIMTPMNYLLFVSLSFLTSLSVMMQFHLFRQNRKTRNAASAAYAGAGGASALVASVFGAVTCSSCAVALFGFLGTGVAFTMIQHRNAIVLVAIALLVAVLAITARRIVNECDACRV